MFCGHHGVFGPFFNPREAKIASEKVNRQTIVKKNFPHTKRTELGYISEKKSRLYDN